MNTKKGRNRIFNILMVAAIAVIAAAGVLGAGMIRGWFDKGTSGSVENAQAESTAVSLMTADKVGGANIYRSGVAYALKDETILRPGDEVETLNLSSMTLMCGDGTVGNIKLDENTRILVKDREDGRLALELVNGSLFADIQIPLQLIVQEHVLETENAVLAASVPYGSGTVTLLSGTARLADQELSAGSMATILVGDEEEMQIRAISLASLNPFEMTALALVSKEREPVFSAEQIRELLAEREAEKQSALEAAFLEEEEEGAIAAARESVANDNQVETSDPSGTETTAASGTDAATKDSTEDLRWVATIEIRCDTILKNLDQLAEGKNAYVPSNGVILKTARISFTEGETAFDVLKRACKLAKISLEYSWTPMYNSYYVEGINNLYQYDCGEESGWMYKVNGWFPNYGASAYKLQDGDSVVWCYTCQGLGDDVGGGM